jgi:hypothetical protein
MKTMRTLTRVLLAVLATVAVIAWGGCDTAAPAQCQLAPSGSGGYAVRFLLDAGSSSCPAEFGDWWGFDPYDNRVNPAAGPLVIGVSSQSSYPDPVDAGSPIYASATFVSVNPDSSGNCQIAQFGPMTTQLFPNDGGTTVTGSFTYNVTNMTWLETASYLGTQWEATVQYTNSDGCTGTYSARALTPPITCSVKSDCDPAPSDPTVAPSGINPAYDTTCDLGPWAQQVAALVGAGDITATDPTVGLCFFAAPYPATGGFTP